MFDSLDREVVVVDGADALAAAFGAALDNPAIVAVCAVGESRAWHLQPQDGAVLPILRVDGHPVYGGLSDEQLAQHFGVFGWTVVFDAGALDLSQRPLLITREAVELNPQPLPPRAALEIPAPAGDADAYLEAIAAANPGRFRVEDDDRGWLDGYIATGRHGVLRGPAPRAGVTTLIEADAVPDAGARWLLPADTNTLLATLERFIDSGAAIVHAAKPLPQYLTLEQAREHVAHGASVWDWASNDEGSPDLVLAACGDIPTHEALAATALLREHVPELRVRFVNVNDLACLAAGSGLSQGQFASLFTKDRPVVFAFHGSPSAIHALTYRRPQQTRFHISDAHDRYSLAIEALTRADILAAEMLPSMSGEFAIRAVPDAERALTHFQGLREAGGELPPFTWDARPAQPSEPPIVM